jgi:hypothetical protein
MLNSLTNHLSIIVCDRLLNNGKGRTRKSLTDAAKEERSKFTMKVVKFSQSGHG